jgi:regulator of RNase E activity RraA
MNLSDVRRIAVRQKSKIEFAVPAGDICVVDDQGVVRIPGLRQAPSYRVSEEFERVEEFQLTGPAGTRRLSRKDLETMCQASGPPGAAEHHED